MLKQRTLAQPISATGVGIHSGRKVEMCLKPAPVGHGIVFKRVDLSGVSYSARAHGVGDTGMSTSLGHGPARVGTIEHLMSAFAGLGVDNCLVELNAPEVPIMDGSAAPFVYLLTCAGILEQDGAKRFIRVLKPIEVSEGDKFVRLEPYNGFKLSFTVQFDHPAIRAEHSQAVIDFNDECFVRALSRARTFGFMRDLEALRARNLGLGGSMSNAIVLDDFRVLNEEGLRFDDEFVRHKMLDAIGDLYLAGAPLLVAYHGHKAGHKLNNMALRALMADASAYQWVELERSGAPKGFVLASELM
jgi:UDP-3-O-[3-hydroxymyristoyl] N-acetylglucosamine deacetylase